MENEDNTLKYVLITPARNEEAHIGRTIESVVAQTVLPTKWIIVSDGSTDRTDDIVRKYLKANTWIELLRMPEHRDRQFAAKVNCFNAAYERVKNIRYHVIGNLDADISFDEDYLEFLLEKFRKIPKLGVAGTPFVEDGYSSVDDSFEGETHVAGGCQLFRRECFEEIGGYIPHKSGGIDWIAVATARMKGWKTISFREKFFHHHRSLGTAESSSLGSSFSYGMKDYYLGGHPLWELFRVFYQATKKPLIIGGVVLLCGYCFAFMRRMERPVSEDLMKFHRREQIEKLKAIFKTVSSFKRLNKHGIGFW
jgi:glycosyltransferase involved in cell wall biosynthesis